MDGYGAGCTLVIGAELPDNTSSPGFETSLIFNTTVKTLLERGILKPSRRPKFCGNEQESSVESIVTTPECEKVAES